MSQAIICQWDICNDNRVDDLLQGIKLCVRPSYVNGISAMITELMICFKALNCESGHHMSMGYLQSLQS